jgi:hypothetical protein
LKNTWKLETECYGFDMTLIIYFCSNSALFIVKIVLNTSQSGLNYLKVKQLW